MLTNADKSGGMQSILDRCLPIETDLYIIIFKNIISIYIMNDWCVQFDAIYFQTCSILFIRPK